MRFIEKITQASFLRDSKEARNNMSTPTSGTKPTAPFTMAFALSAELMI